MRHSKDRNIEKLQAIGSAITQAREFLKKAELAHLALTSEKEGFSHSKSFAAAKRSSMDLTRALAKMRGAAA
jgi:hypothetical protein